MTEITPISKSQCTKERGRSESRGERHLSFQFYPRMFCARFGWNCPSGSGDDFVKLSVYFYNLAFTGISPKNRPWSFIWKKMNPIYSEWFVPSLVEISPVLLEKKIFESRQYISTRSLLSPLINDAVFHLNKLESKLEAKFGWTWSKQKCKKFTTYIW